MEQVPITKNGAELMSAELKELKSVKRPAVIQAIAEAREHGDLKENAEYHAAREEQGFIEARIKDLESKLSNAQIIDVTTLSHMEKVVFGATVVVFDEEKDDDEEESAHTSFQQPKEWGSLLVESQQQQQAITTL